MLFISYRCCLVTRVLWLTTCEVNFYFVIIIIIITTVTSVTTLTTVTTLHICLLYFYSALVPVKDHCRHVFIFFKLADLAKPGAALQTAITFNHYFILSISEHDFLIYLFLSDIFFHIMLPVFRISQIPNDF